MVTPIIFVHKGDPYYLKYALRQVKYFNPDSPIYLLGDETNNVYPFVTHINFNKYQVTSNKFAENYKHRSDNYYNYELFCFERWFCIRDFAKEHKIESFIYLDSDVLAFQSFSKIIPELAKYKITITGKEASMPAFTYCKDYNSINQFCDFLLNYYTDENLINRLDKWHENFLKAGVYGGVCDMTIFDFFFKENEDQTAKIDKVGNLRIDMSISDTRGYEEDNNIKKIYWVNQSPFCKLLKTGELVQFATLHYQGATKIMMPRHYQAGGYTLVKKLDPLYELVKRFRINLENKVRRMIRK